MLLCADRAVPFPTTLASLLVGYLANNVLPARLGEVVRSHDLGTRTGLSRPTILGTIVIERVVDTIVVVAIASIAILVLSVRGIVASACSWGSRVSALLVVAVAVGIAAHRLPGAERVAAFLDRWPRVRALARAAARRAGGREQRADDGDRGRLSIASWSCTVLAFAAAAQAVGVEPTIGQAALLAAGTNLATAIPAGPGYVGTFELATVTIARVGRDRQGAALALACRRSRSVGTARDADRDLEPAARSPWSLSGGPRLGGRRRRRTDRPRRSRHAATTTRPHRRGRQPSPDRLISRAPGRTPGTRAPADARGLGRGLGVRGATRYLTRPCAFRNVETTSLMSFLSTLTCLYRSARVAVSILADRSSRSLVKAALSVLAR